MFKNLAFSCRTLLFIALFLQSFFSMCFCLCFSHKWISIQLMCVCVAKRTCTQRFLFYRCRTINVYDVECYRWCSGSYVFYLKPSLWPHTRTIKGNNRIMVELKWSLADVLTTIMYIPTHVVRKKRDESVSIHTYIYNIYLWAHFTDKNMSRLIDSIWTVCTSLCVVRFMFLIGFLFLFIR